MEAARAHGGQSGAAWGRAERQGSGRPPHVTRTRLAAPGPRWPWRLPGRVCYAADPRIPAWGQTGPGWRGPSGEWHQRVEGTQALAALFSTALAAGSACNLASPSRAWWPRGKAAPTLLPRRGGHLRSTPCAGQERPPREHTRRPGVPGPARGPGSLKTQGKRQLTLAPGRRPFQRGRACGLGRGRGGGRGGARTQTRTPSLPSGPGRRSVGRFLPRAGACSPGCCGDARVATWPGSVGRGHTFPKRPVGSKGLESSKFNFSRCLLSQ